MKSFFALFAFFVAVAVNGQVLFNTGNSEFDADLNTINTNAKTDVSAFNAELQLTFGVTDKNIQYMTSIKMQPAEMYLALEIARSLDKPVELVVDTYEANREKGWGAVAQELGIKPGSPEFHALKGKSKEKKDKVSPGNGNANSNADKKSTGTNVTRGKK